jgi:hypothetical protein
MIEKYIKHAISSHEMANRNISKLNQEILDLPGYTGNKTRHLYNNLCNLDGITYLEVGTWLGSSLISALYGNTCRAFAIENWSEEHIGSNKDSYKIFEKNTASHLKTEKFSLIEKDCFLLDEQDVEPSSIDIYLYDGHHESYSQELGITYFEKFLSKYSIIIVDDWSWEKVRYGTFEGFKKSNLEIRHKIEHFSSDDRQGYWNGFGLFVCEKMN